VNPQDILKQYWGYDTFRPMQAEVVAAVLSGHDVLALMPTGGGKSICFQVPGLMTGGLCVVVSPLIALMKDQVEQLRRRHIKAVAVYSGMHRHEIDLALDNCIYGNVRFLYVAPERLQTTLFKERVKQMDVRLLAIDEAHCVSAWGYDFRPSYLNISAFREVLPPTVPLIALTATATAEVQADIVEKLAMRRLQHFQRSFARPNLSYSTFLEENKERKLLDVLQKVPGVAVVYVRSRRRTQEIAQWLSSCGISATYYHAGLSPQERSKRQDDWILNKVRVMVATNAFGMGIDKPDVRVVVHMDLPDNLEAYYQEAGRAGRDERKAYAVALYGPKDLEDLERHVLQAYPSGSIVRQTYQALANYYQLAVGAGELATYEFDLQVFQAQLPLSSIEVFFALKLLEDEGFIQVSEALSTSAKVHFEVDNRGLYEFQVANARYDAFTKLLLRMYGGELYGQFVNISEGALAKAYRVPLEEVVQMLQYLQQAGIIAYQPAKNKPQLTFLTPRYDAQSLPLALHDIERRKQRDLNKSKKVAHYAQHKLRCRTQLLLEYFGEITDQTCGICDNCLHKKKRLEAGSDVEQYRLVILEQLRLEPQPLGRLVAHLKGFNEARILEVIKLMLGDAEIAYDALGNLYLVG
jgi:ATP-dependent DNA helicase RecQ